MVLMPPRSYPRALPRPTMDRRMFPLVVVRRIAEDRAILPGAARGRPVAATERAGSPPPVLSGPSARPRLPQQPRPKLPLRWPQVYYDRTAAAIMDSRRINGGRLVKSLPALPQHQPDLPADQ